MTTLDDLYWDPIDVAIDDDPYDTWRRLRDEAPVYRNERYDFWALSRFADVEAAHRDPVTFVSSHGTVLELMTDQPVPSGMMIFQDPPEHTRLRSLVSRAFTPRRTSGLEAHIRELCAELLAPWRDGADFDFVADFGATLPSMVICELLGVPAADRAWVKDKIDTTFHIEPDVGMVNDVSLTARIELDGYLTALLTERAAAPGDDLLSGLTQADLTLRESADFANLLVSAGTETVARLLGWAGVVLDEHPGQRAALVADPSLVPNAVEELLRFEAPSPVQGRWTSRPVVLHGTEVPAAAKVLLLTGSAGRDERQYPDADRFDVRRRFDQHVSFGYGIHFCLGASLARIEGRVALEEALRRHPTWQVDRERAVRLHTSTVRGWSSVPVR
ncbi:MAG TPA: cytochrome P450 [Acidimicrobiales bacterium]